MAAAWFLCPYSLIPGFLNRRYCAMDDFTDVIVADGGRWREIEVLGNSAIVRVRASAATLTTIAGTFTRLPNVSLDTTLSSLTGPQQTALKNKVLALGYTLGELSAALGTDLTVITLRALLVFMKQRRMTPRFDGSSIVFDGAVVADNTDLDVVEQGVG